MKQGKHRCGSANDSYRNELKIVGYTYQNEGNCCMQYLEATRL